MIAVFVDTGAWFARFVASDLDHPAAHGWFDQNTRPLVTTDYVVDELLTLLKMRGEFSIALAVGPRLLCEDICDLIWVTPADFNTAWGIFSTHQDKGWSFNDCVSRVVIERLAIDTAVAFDSHFRQFGMVTVVP